MSSPIIRFALFIAAVIVFLVLTTAIAQAKEREISGYERHTYKEVDGRKLSLYVTKPEDWKPSDQRPAAVFYHGGGWVGGQPGQFAPHGIYLASRGMVVVLVEYRLVDRKSKELPDNCVNDAKSGMRWVRSHASELGIDPNRIASGGGSAGGHLAAFVGCVDGGDDPADDTSVSAKSQAMLLFNPVCDNGPGEWGNSRVGDEYPRFSPAHNITSDDPPAIYFLGDKDKLIPVSTAERFQEKMQDAGVRCEVHIFKDGPHGFFNKGKGDGTAYYETVELMDRFLASLGWIEGEPTLKRE
ncbi:alpha/beta hydrolase [Calycomorphotria hydatis]|uniref:Acetylxylan esterase n=1 Tax=Calycomorphotria hydatis TaxID=2528027 RepID=A0A517T626_9PLAN|nr:alpha/beta hydrolase [Calycomorphotria hydatis]QDT63811.1 Acetylxylan esterase precursor [Calycomorphotria hydatis]